MRSHAEKYGASHRAIRARLKPIVKAGRAVCWRCGEPIAPNAEWHLGHSDDGTRWMGPEHATCNLRDGGRKRAAELFGPRPEAVVTEACSPSRWSRHWAGGFDVRCPECRAAGTPCADATQPTNGSTGGHTS